MYKKNMNEQKICHTAIEQQPTTNELQAHTYIISWG